MFKFAILVTFLSLFLICIIVKGRSKQSKETINEEKIRQIFLANFSDYTSSVDVTLYNNPPLFYILRDLNTLFIILVVTKDLEIVQINSDFQHYLLDRCFDGKPLPKFVMNYILELNRNECL